MEILGGYSFLACVGMSVLLLPDEPRLHELVEGDEVQLRERCVKENPKVAVLGHYWIHGDLLLIRVKVISSIIVVVYTLWLHKIVQIEQKNKFYLSFFEMQPLFKAKDKRLISILQGNT